MLQRPGLQITTIIRNILLVIGFVLLLLFLTGIFVYRSKVQPKRDEYFLDKEVIVINQDPAYDMADLPADVADINANIVLTLDPDRSVDITDLLSNSLVLGPPTIASATLQSADVTASCAQLAQTLQINLYTISGSEAEVEAALEAITQATAGNDVFAEANWVIGAPWSPTGSPWSPTGSPWSPTGSDLDQGAPTPASSDDFAKQWAFTTIDLSSAKAIEQDAEDPQNVWVGVFDTSPMKAQTVSGAEVVPAQAASNNVLNVKIEEPDFVNQPAPPEPGSREDIDVSNHGYFGTSFMREIASGSQISLIPVLTKNNRGDLATLNKELLIFMTDAYQQANVRAVVNMSLGVPPLEPFKLFPWLPLEFPPPFELERQLNSLEIVSQIGECLDVVMVAAAGNDSSESLKVANYPASWGNVLSVTSSNMANEQACYANEGEVAAPGGDGGPSEPGAKNPLRCEPKLHLCTGPDCPYSVIGYVHPETLSPEEAAADVQYHHWVGTSFATPMVTGLAALLRTHYPELTAAEVREAILCGTVEPSSPQGVRVINIGQALACAEITE